MGDEGGEDEGEDGAWAVYMRGEGKEVSTTREI